MCCENRASIFCSAWHVNNSQQSVELTLRRLELAPFPSLLRTAGGRRGLPSSLTVAQVASQANSRVMLCATRPARLSGFLDPFLQVTFTRAAHFVRNRVSWKDQDGPAAQSSSSPSSPCLSLPPSSSSSPSSSEARAHPCGGGVSVGSSGRVNFRELASFEGNSASRGGALCNRGWVKFFRRSFFNENFATGGKPWGGGGGGRDCLYLCPTICICLDAQFSIFGSCSCLFFFFERFFLPPFSLRHSTGGEK